MFGTNHKAYKEGLNLALNNYLNGVGFELPLQYWFEFDIVETSLRPNFIESGLV